MTGYIPAAFPGARLIHGDDWTWKQDAPKYSSGQDEQIEAEARANARREVDDLVAAYHAKWLKWFGGNHGFLLPVGFDDNGVPDYGIAD